MLITDFSLLFAPKFTGGNLKMAKQKIKTIMKRESSFLGHEVLLNDMRLSRIDSHRPSPAR